MTENSARTGATVSPSDSTNLTAPCRGLNVAAAGNVVVTLVDMADGTNVTLYLAAGVVHPLSCKRVWNTNTTATGIVALY